MSAMYYKQLQEFGFGPEAMNQIKVCAKCGAQCESTKQFCGECGAALPKETLFDTYRQKSRVCSICGMVVPRDATFCPECGWKLAANSCQSA